MNNDLKTWQRKLSDIFLKDIYISKLSLGEYISDKGNLNAKVCGHSGSLRETWKIFITYQKWKYIQDFWDTSKEFLESKSITLND